MEFETPTYTNSPVCASLQVRAREAVGDIRDSFKSHSLWIQLGLRSLRGQYQRTYLGPLWISVQSLLLTVVLASLRSALNDGTAFGDTLAFVGLGLPIVMLWTSASARSTSTFRAASALIHRNNLTSIVVFQRWFAELLEFFHEILPILLLVVVVYHPLTFQPIQFLLALFLISLTTLSFRFWLGTIGSRFRDLEPIISALNRMHLFLCPIFWSISELPEESILRPLSQVLPTTYFVTSFRDSLIGTRDSSELLINPTYFMLVFTLASCSLGFVFYVKYRKLIPYWQLAE